MQVHLLPEVPASLTGIDEFPAELEPEPDVIGTASPIPLSDTGRGSGGRLRRRDGVRMDNRRRRPSGAAMPRIVAVARLYAALATSTRYCVRHRSTRYGVDEGGLATT